MQLTRVLQRKRHSCFSTGEKRVARERLHVACDKLRSCLLESKLKNRLSSSTVAGKDVISPEGTSVIFPVSDVPANCNQYSSLPEMKEYMCLSHR